MVALGKLDLDFDGQTFVKNKDGAYLCKCYNKETKVLFCCVFAWCCLLDVLYLVGCAQAHSVEQRRVICDCVC